MEKKKKEWNKFEKTSKNDLLTLIFFSFLFFSLFFSKFSKNKHRIKNNNNNYRLGKSILELAYMIALFFVNNNFIEC